MPEKPYRFIYRRCTVHGTSSVAIGREDGPDEFMIGVACPCPDGKKVFWKSRPLDDEDQRRLMLVLQSSEWSEDAC